MEYYSTCELKTAWKTLYKTACDELWKKINCELAKRLGKIEYISFVANFR